MININEIEKQVQESIKHKINSELDNYDIFEIIEQHLGNIVHDKVNVTVTALLNRLINENTVADQINGLSSAKIQEKLDLAIKARIAQTVSQTDVGTEISSRITQFVENRMMQAALPDNFIPAAAIDWSNFALAAGHIGTGTIENFCSTGIEDRASTVGLTVLDGQVIVEKQLIANDLKIVNVAEFRDATVNGRFTVNGTLVINDSAFNQSLCSLIDNRITRHHENNPLDLNGAALVSNTVKLIDNRSLGSTVTESNLRKLGRLISLEVAGTTELAETLYVSNGKIGINTDEPTGVFTVWDEEAEISIRKYKNRNMYIGSTRDSELTLGVGGNSVLEINRNGIATASIKLGNVTITASSVEPTHRGAPGDLVINQHTDPSQPWAWRCVGAAIWKPLT
jgi:hypothetical protein